MIICHTIRAGGIVIAVPRIIYEEQKTHENPIPAIAHRQKFNPQIRNENAWAFIYEGHGYCHVFVWDDSIEVRNFYIIDWRERGQGHGRKMVKMIREAFPEQHIWVDTWEHSRPFWEKMREEGWIDHIANDYHWPCMDTTCAPCNPNRGGRYNVR